MVVLGSAWLASPARAEPFIYAGQHDKVVVTDTATDSVVGSPLELGNFVQRGIVSRDGKRVYVANGTCSKLWVIDATTNRLVTTIPLPGRSNYPYGLALSPNGKYVYVVSSSGRVSLIDTVSNQPVGRPIIVGAGSYRIACAPDGKKAYVTSEGTNSLSVIDTVISRKVGTIKVGELQEGKGRPAASPVHGQRPRKPTLSCATGGIRPCRAGTS